MSLFAMGVSFFAADQSAIRQVSSEGIRHSILICGRQTQLINEKSEVVWQVNENSRDGSVLQNGNILFSANNVAKEMTRDMKVVWRYALAKPNKELGTVWRLANGNTVVNLTHGNKTVEFDAKGRVVWRVDNSHVAGRFADPCGGQRLPNGNTVISSYAQRDSAKVRVFEVNLEKEVVWELFHPDSNAHGIHVISTNGKPLSNARLK